MEHMLRITFIKENKQLQAAPGTPLLELMRQEHIPVSTPCGGNGTCGKCTVLINGNQYEKACQYTLIQDTVIDTSQCMESPTAILTDFHSPEGMRASDTLPCCMDECDTSPDSSPAQLPGYMAAFDIGTTTVAGYLIDAHSGRTAAVSGCPNPQAVYGADVMSRIQYALEHDVSDLTRSIRESLNRLLQEMTQKACVTPYDVYAMSAVGNTCMHHLLLGIRPESLGFAPYRPVISDALIMKASSLQIEASPNARIFLPPVIAGFVGSDTLAGMIVSRLADEDAWTLLIDIGTNGEIVLGRSHQLFACSAAAGPAFEGAGISCGMTGSSGAICRVRLDKNIWNYETIENEMPRGICGSGLLDAIAQALKNGMIDETGAITGSSSLLLVPASESASGKAISLTQKDIRQFQLAKAAIAAGVRILANHAGICVEDIQKVWLAGAFGNYLSEESACTVGLIPKVLSGRIKAIGNAAGEGARQILLDQNVWKEAARLAHETTHVELASTPDFQEIFVDELEFPEIQ